MDEQLLTEKLIGYDTSHAEGIKQCAGFVKGWLDARDIDTRQIAVRDLPVTLAEVGPADAAIDRCCCTATSTWFPVVPSSSSPASTATAWSAGGRTT